MYFAEKGSGPPGNKTGIMLLWNHVLRMFQSRIRRDDGNGHICSGLSYRLVERCCINRHLLHEFPSDLGSIFLWRPFRMDCYSVVENLKNRKEKDHEYFVAFFINDG